MKKLLLFMIIAISTLPNGNSQTFVKGADISWSTQQTASGYKWYNDSGVQKPLHTILKDHHIKAVRLRVWVNPAGGWCNQNDVVAKAKAAKSAGMDVMIDFHYSDTWADPGHQTPPASWAKYNINQMMDAVWNHTVSVLTAVKNAGVTPKWVQIGNETNDGMLWPLGKASTGGFKNYAWFVSTGNNAAKSVFPSIKTIVHIANGDNLSVLQWNLDGLKNNGATYDIIGLSLYPGSSWTAAANSYAYNIANLKSRYGKSTMLCELGMNASPINTAYDAMYDIINKTAANGGLGVFIWEPQGYNNWQGYTKHCWESNGRPTWALDAFVWSNGGSRTTDVSDQFTNEAISIYPNPVTQQKVTIEGLSGSTTISLIDLSGKLITTSSTERSIFDLKLNIQAGTYFIRLEDQNGTEVRKISVK
jgi:arabinogalactan endo-1,4-beta-galactosidase